MAEAQATLEAQFLITSGSSIETLRQIQDAMNSTEGKIVQQAAQIERATNGMVKVGNATAQISVLGNAFTKEGNAIGQSMARIERSAEGMIRQLERQALTFGKSASEIRQMNVELKATAAESRGLTELATRLRAAGMEMARLESSAHLLPGASNAARTSMQNLGFQMQDFAVQVVGGTSVLRAFAMQAPQAAGALTGFGGVLGRVGGFLAGPWGIALTVATTLVAGLAEELLSGSSAAEKASESLAKVKFSSSAVGEAQSILGNIMDLTTGKITSQSAALRGLAQAQLAVARVQAQARQAEARGQIAGAGKLGFLESFAHVLDSNKAVVGRGQVQDIMRSVLEGATTTKAAITTLENLNKAGMVTDDVFAKAAAAVANFGVEGENLKVFNSAERMLNGVGNAIDRGLILKAPRAKRAIKETNDALKELMATAKGLADTKMEAQGGVGQLAQDMIERQREWGKDQIPLGKQMIDQARELEDLTEARADGERQVLEYYLRQLDAVRQIGGTLGQVAGIIAGMADGGNFVGVGGNLGKLLNLSTGVIGKDGWKQVTDKLDSIFGTAGDGSFARTMSKTLAAAGIGQTAAAMFGMDSKTEKIGGALGGIAGKVAGKALGDAIGGTLGSAMGPLGSMLGGILGGALGGLFKKHYYGTATVTGMGAGDVSTAGNKGGYKSNAGLAATSIQDGLQAIADQFGAAVGNFNVSIGQYDGKWRVNTNGYKGKLDFKGQSAIGLTSFGKDGAEDAIKFAIADAISDGALLGLRMSTQTLLKGGKDVELQLQKALKLEGVFSDLKAELDPVGYALDNLTKEFDQLKKVFNEAGASAEEYAQLQQLYDIKRKEALKDANEELLSRTRDRRTLEARILELQGRSLESITALRAIELEQMDEALRPLQQQIYALEDAQEAADAAKQLRDAWASIGDSIMEEVRRIRGLTGSGTASFATLMGEFNAVTAAARMGDQAAAGRLVGLSGSLIDAANLSARSQRELNRVKAQIASSLEATAKLTAGVTQVATAANNITTPAAQVQAAASAAQASVPVTGSNDNSVQMQLLRNDLNQMKADLVSGLAALKGDTGSMKRTLDNVTSASGGDAIATVAAA